ncbi:hypothetical protein KL86DYS1_10218 [uncultured Dysgonomonas sp.]|uniref:Uncharacterized protein n=1 Tax=uncultured Dysgonomonas sp. TaxID=206096 RepID=A0A212IUW6_9BACT|nr:hypothetical protein KL86DYS1_10218 [uncultured Dysgonomonas sp.]
MLDLSIHSYFLFSLFASFLLGLPRPPGLVLTFGIAKMNIQTQQSVVYKKRLIKSNISILQ